MKKVIVFILALVLSLSSVMVVMADDTSSDTSDVVLTTTLPELPNDNGYSFVTVIQSSSGRFCGLVHNDIDIFCTYYSEDGNSYPCFDIEGPCVYYWLEDNAWTVKIDNSDVASDYILSIGFRDFPNYTVTDFLSEWTGAFIYSDVPITNGDTLETFFHPTPSSTTLFLGLSGQKLYKMTMNQIVGLSPLVLGFLTLALALHKGLRMLLVVLARA